MGRNTLFIGDGRRVARRSAVLGFSLLELVVVIVIISVLVAIALSRLLPYIDEAERVAVLTVESQIKITFFTSAAKRIASGRAAPIYLLNRSKAKQLMLGEPKNYFGELRGSH